MKQRVKRRQERQEKCSSWKRSWEGRKSWMQGVGRRKRGETRGGGIGWLNQCTLPLQILSTLSLSHSNKHTDTQWFNLCQYEVRSPPFPPSLQQPSYSVPVHVCVCGSLNHSSLTFLSRWRIDCWDTETEEYSLDLSTFETFFNFRTPSAPSVLFFFQTLGWNFCWETASLRRLCYWNIQFLLGFWTLIRD